MRSIGRLGLAAASSLRGSSPLVAWSSASSAGAMVFQGGYRPLKAGVISVASVLIFYAVFEIWFQVPLLKGPIEAWLKLH